MQIVIDIPDEEYETVKMTGGCYYDFGKAIVNGTLLPKGHGDLIDVDELLKKVRARREKNEWMWELIEYSEIEKAPTIIEADTESENE